MSIIGILFNLFFEFANGFHKWNSQKNDERTVIIMKTNF